MQIAVRLVSLIILCLLGFSPMSAQTAKKKAEKFYKEKEYQKAYDHYMMIKNIEKDKASLAKRGISSFHINKLISASKDLTAAYKMGNTAAELKFYMGRINHSMRKYEDAIFFYKSYLRALKANEEIRPDVALYIKNCFSGLKQSYVEEDLGFVENAGDLVNSKADEINPVPSPTIVNRYYYSSNRAQDNYDLYSAEMIEGKWKQGHHIHPSLNTDENEILQDCSIDGSVMVFLRGDQTGSNRLYLNRYSESKHNQRVVFSETKAVTGDRDVYLINDEKMIFASNRLGGFGGYDLYISEFTTEGWSSPKNLGAGVNSSYDERYPFMKEDESELFFSSNNPNSIGGFDIFSVEKIGDTWSEIYSYSYPINSPEDDVQFRIQEEGFQAYMSSNRKSSTLGGYDIYTVFLRKATKPHTSEAKQPLSLIRSSVKDEDYAYDETDDEFFKHASEKIETKPDTISKSVAAKEGEVELIDQNPELSPKEDYVETDTTEVLDKEPIDEKVDESTAEKNPNDLEKTPEEIGVDQQDPIKEDSINEVEEIDENLDEPEDLSVNQEVESSKEPQLDKNNAKGNRSNKRKKVDEKSSEDLSELTYESIYYSESDLLNEQHMAILNEVASDMRKLVDSKVILTCYSLPEGLPEFELMFSIKRTEKLAKYLIEQGVEENRIILKGLGSSYPYIKKVIEKNLYDEYKMYNNRIDLKLVNYNQQSEVIQPVIDDKLLSPKYPLYQTVIEDVYFRVFIHETEKKMYKNAILRFYNDLLIEKDLVENSYKYYVGLYTDFKSAFELKRELENRNVSEARIVAYLNGNLLSISDAKILQDQYPELINYIEINQ